MSAEAIALMVGAAIGCVGVMEWLKGFPKLKDLPTWVWRLILAPVSVGVAFAVGGELIPFKAILILTIAQLGYPVLVQLPAALIEKFRKSVVA